jgi:uncharacterized protein (DUF1800 family)
MRASMPTNDFVSLRVLDGDETRSRPTHTRALRRFAFCAVAIAIAVYSIASTSIVYAQINAGTGDLDGSGTLDTADVGLMVEFVTGETPVTAGDLVTSDVAPLGGVDTEVHVNDLSVLIRALTEQDLDGDGLVNDAELGAGASPFSSDSDGDGLDDGFEVLTLGTFAYDPDTDGDGFDDLFEYNAGYDPLDEDMDDDGVLDGVDECARAFNPGETDTDGDSIPDECDNCMRMANPGQEDDDEDGFGDACDTESVCEHGTGGDDPDRDRICGTDDPCPNWLNTDWPQDPNLCLCGDIDNNGNVDESDVTAYNNYLTTGNRSYVSASHKCDIDGDGICTAADRDFVDRLVSDSIALPSPGLCADYQHVEDHVLSRIGFGADAYGRHLIREIGVDDYIEEQLDPSGISDPGFEFLATQYDSSGTEFPTLDSTQATGLKNMNFLHTQYGVNVARTRFDLSEMKLQRAIFSKRQLEAVMLDLMFNHMNVDATSGRLFWPYATIMHYEKAIRESLLGPFEHMVQASAESAAMLDYLDQQRNTAASINENYGREIMELHTVGARDTDGARIYDQTTVVNASKILTGYELNYVGIDWDPMGADNQTDWHFLYDDTDQDGDPNAHDINDKVVVIGGETWTFTGPDGVHSEPAPPAPATRCAVGNEGNQGEVFICLLSRHPATAERIAALLVNRFVSEDSSDPDVAALIAAAAGAYLTPNDAGEIGSLRDTLEFVLASPLFLDATYFRGKVKRPFISIASAFRALGKGSEGESITRDEHPNGLPSAFKNKAHYRGVFESLRLMDEQPFEAGPPTGFDTSSSSAVSSGGVLVRGNSARDQVMTQWGGPDHGAFDLYPIFGIESTATNADVVDILIDRLLPGGIRRRTTEALDTSTRNLIIESLDRTSGQTPDSQTLDSRVRRAATMLLSSPEFLLH